MKKIAGYIKDFVRQDFHRWFYLYAFVFLAITITLNYTFDFERVYLNSAHNSEWTIVYYFLFYSAAYFSMALPQSLWLGGNFHRSPEFWIKSLIFILILSVDAGFYYHGEWLLQQDDLSDDEMRYVYRVLNNVYPTIIYLPVLLVVKLIYDRKSGEGLYGLTLKRFDPVPYLTFLLIMAPVIFYFSFQRDFQYTYPQLKPWKMDDAFGWPEWKLSLVFETAYLLDFTWVELLFRGAMIVGLSAVMGRHVVVPMMVCYAFLHFGKPAAETIGSVFGGYLLGIIALYSRNILGGCAIHMGIAFLMEVAALAQHYIIKE